MVMKYGYDYEKKRNSIVLTRLADYFEPELCTMTEKKTLVFTIFRVD